MTSSSRKPLDVSVIIPTLNEQDHVAAAIQSAQAAGAGETIISDGGSTDDTQATATAAGATKFVRSLPGRGTQLAGGLSVAAGEVVLFLHADNLLSVDCLNQICQLDEFVWGAFKQQIDSHKPIYRAIELGNAARVSWRGMAFGDQAIFANRKALMSHGGVSEIPLMEDVDLSRRLRKLARPVLLDGPVQISSRRWEQTGVLRQTIRNWTLQVRYAAGATPESLADRY
ncbi:Glucosyl-3-phosphoglycerate synthase [Rubripirellula obstinata]|uniref:Glucosyl-3-phosphoglycerate synthase n=1 Tax=Rubripirellula obstinata TaxID=406547 RepID=A0A5B1CL20_9BACT|nr:TIGR04283 family arsenosugar biosynthesis glycosyltransferase [Rubripirellula obstinata]KAA1260024.1 Glucosyl-3-phosphoglycerate synthase [Rubripirellula obstinata]